MNNIMSFLDRTNINPLLMGIDAVYHLHNQALKSCHFFQLPLFQFLTVNYLWYFLK